MRNIALNALSQCLSFRIGAFNRANSISLLVIVERNNCFRLQCSEYSISIRIIQQNGQYLFVRTQHRREIIAQEWRGGHLRARACVRSCESRSS